MAVTGTVSALSASIKTHFSDDFMESHQNNNAPLLKKFESLKKISQNGKTFDWEFRLASPQNIGTPTDGGATPTLKARSSQAGSVTVAQFVGGFDISPLAEALATSSGSWNGGEVKRSIQETVDDVTKHMNRLYAGTHGTGRIAQVNANTSASADWVGKLPFGTLLVRPNMKLSAYTADSSGSVRDSLDDITVSKVVTGTRTVTMAAGTYTLTANDHVYIAGSYGSGRTPNGLRGLVDDGTHLTTIHGKSRSTYEELKSVVLTNSSTLRPITEDLFIDLAHGVRQRSGHTIDLAVMNFGQLAQFFKHVRADRRLNVSGAEIPSYNVGYKKLPTFYFGGQEVEILASEDVAPREVYGITTSQMKRIVAKKLGWMDWGGSIFQQTITSSNYTLGKQATLLGLENLATYVPAAHGRIDDLSDPQLCGTAVGGTDS